MMVPYGSAFLLRDKLSSKKKMFSRAIYRFVKYDSQRSHCIQRHSAKNTKCMENETFLSVIQSGQRLSLYMLVKGNKLTWWRLETDLTLMGMACVQSMEK
jgi:hypothetical protein